MPNITTNHAIYKSLAWRAVIGDAVLEDFRGKDDLCLFRQLITRFVPYFKVFKF